MDEYLSKIKSEIITVVFWRDVIAEFFATFTLIAAICAVTLNFDDHSKSIPLEAGLVVGFTVVFLVESFGHLGGAHLNPAVSFSFMLYGNITIIKGSFYILSQCIGAIAGSFFVKFITPEEYWQNLGVTVPANDVPAWKALIAEVWLTGQLVFVILSTTDNKKGSSVILPSIPIGFAVTVGILTGWNYSSGSLNPARSFGPAVAMGVWTSHWIYWLGPIGGAAIATALYRFGLRKPNLQSFNDPTNSNNNKKKNKKNCSSPKKKSNTSTNCHHIEMENRRNDVEGQLLCSVTELDEKI